MTSHNDGRMSVPVCCGTPRGVSGSDPAGTSPGQDGRLARHTREAYSLQGVTMIYPHATHWWGGAGEKLIIICEISILAVSVSVAHLSQCVDAAQDEVDVTFFFFLGSACSCRCCTSVS